MKSVLALVAALALLTFTVIEAEAANDPQAVQKNFHCMDLRKATSKLPVYVTNIANKDTTRTPEGGPFKRIDLVCHSAYCEQIAKADFRLMRQPDHPDANGAGYVQYPRIDVAQEYGALTSAAAEVRLLAQTQACGANVLAGPNTTLVKYAAGDSLQSDTFNYATDGHLTSWTRLNGDGTSKTFAFNADGSLLSK